MSVTQFLAAVLPESGHRFALVTFGQQGADDFRPVQKAFSVAQTNELINFSRWGDDRGGNAYFAVAGFDLVLNDKGKPQRLATAARLHRCLRIDIDVGDMKGYTDRRTALVEILRFAQTYQLPTPWIVDSGGGFHVYWAFDRDLDQREWLPLAARLHAATQQAGLQVDTTTTLDAARVLRVPDTRNHKPRFGTNPPLVRVLQVGASASPERVAAHLPDAGSLTGALAPTALSLRAGGPNSELGANLHEPYFMADILAQCPGMAAMRADGGARCPEPLWKLALDLINKSDDEPQTKATLALEISQGHPSFSPDGLDRKWQQVVAQDYHPPTCARLGAAGLPECATCPLRGKISSPLVLGRPRILPASDAAVPLTPPVATAAPAPTPTQAPAPVAQPAALIAAPAQQIGVFLIDHTTKIKVTNGKLNSRLSIVDGYPTVLRDLPPGDDGVRKQVNTRLLDYRLLAVERMLDPVHKRSIVVLTFERGLDGPAGIEFDNGDFAEPKRFYNKMNAEGLYCNRKDVGEFVDKFMSEFLSQLQRARAASQIAGRCGWTDDLSAFVLGQQMYRRGGGVEHVRTAVAPGEMEGYHAAGNEALWRRAFDIALSAGTDRQCILALSLAGPLMVFTGLNGVLLSAYSPESGVGKSTLCDAALSVWGSPDTLRKDFRDTANATFKLASVSGNMPMVIDEFTNVDGRALSDYVYTITQGREKHRLNSDAQLTKGGAQRWCLAAIATSNNSVHEKLLNYRADSMAEAARVFEMRLYPLQVDATQMGMLKTQLDELRRNYGFLGPKLLQIFMAKPPEYWRARVMDRIAKWDREVSTSASDRFRSATCALIEIGAALGAALGFAFDPAAVERELRRHWTKQVTEFEQERRRPMDFVNAYVLQHIGEFVTIGGARGDTLITTNMPRRFYGEVRGTAKDGMFVPQTIMIPMDTFREFIRERNGNFKAIMEGLTASPAVTRRGRLVFLEHTINAMQTDAIEFRHADVLGAKRGQLTTVPTQKEKTA